MAKILLKVGTARALPRRTTIAARQGRGGSLGRRKRPEIP